MLGRDFRHGAGKHDPAHPGRLDTRPLGARQLRTPFVHWSAARALVVRVNEKVSKLALLHAISADPAAPVITAEGVDWAVRFVRHVTEDMLFESQFHVAEGRFDALVKRFVGLLAKNGGQLDRRTLMRKLPVDHGTFKRIALTLHMCDMIDEERLDARKFIYTLKNAA